MPFSSATSRRRRPIGDLGNFYTTYDSMSREFGRRLAAAMRCRKRDIHGRHHRERPAKSWAFWRIASFSSSARKNFPSAAEPPEGRPGRGRRRRRRRAPTERGRLRRVRLARPQDEGRHCRRWGREVRLVQRYREEHSRHRPAPWLDLAGDRARAWSARRRVAWQTGRRALRDSYSRPLTTFSPRLGSPVSTKRPLDV